MLGLRASPLPPSLLHRIANHLWPFLTMVRFPMSLCDGSKSDYFPAGYQIAGPSSQISFQSTNGPNTFDEALKHLGFSVEERRRIAGDPFHGSSANSLRAPTILPHPPHLSPQGYTAQTIHHSHSQYMSPNQAVAATHDRGTWCCRSSQ